MRTLDLLKLMLDAGHIDMRKIQSIVSYWRYIKDTPGQLESASGSYSVSIHPDQNQSNLCWLTFLKAHPCRYGGNGRRAVFKFQFWRQSEGSSLSTRTIRLVVEVNI